jgi:hypothetical protein
VEKSTPLEAKPELLKSEEGIGVIEPIDERATCLAQKSRSDPFLRWRLRRERLGVATLLPGLGLPAECLM